MPGVPGKGGPPPKRSDERRRRNNENGQRDVSRAPGASEVPIPDPDENWHPVALGWYRSLAESGQSVYYEPSDWATAYLLAESIHVLLSSGKFSAVLFQSIMSSMSELLVTEGSRRRVRVELERGTGVDPDQEHAVTALADYRKRLNG